MCEMSGGGSPRYLNTFSNLVIVAVHYTHINTCSPLQNIRNTLYLVSIVDCTHNGSATDSLHRRTLQQIFLWRISFSLLWTW